MAPGTAAGADVWSVEQGAMKFQKTPGARFIELKLMPHEMHIASMVACLRQTENLYAGRKDAHGASGNDGEGWGLHILGCLGEMAVAKALNIYWNGALGNLDADDVGEWQVRTRSEHHYDLIVHDSDPDDKRFVLVTAKPPLFRIHGWILGVKAKEKQFWKDPAKGRPAFFVHKLALTPFGET